MVEGRGNRKGEREWEREGLKSRSKSWQRQQLHDVQLQGGPAAATLQHCSRPTATATKQQHKCSVCSALPRPLFAGKGRGAAAAAATATATEATTIATATTAAAATATAAAAAGEAKNIASSQAFNLLCAFFNLLLLCLQRANVLLRFIYPPFPSPSP